MLHVHVLHQDINLTNVCTCWTSCCQQGFYFKSLCLFTAVQTDCVMVTVSKGSTHTSWVVSMWEEGIWTKDYGKCMQGFIHHRVCWWGVLSLFSFIFHYASILILKCQSYKALKQFLLNEIPAGVEYTGLWGTTERVCNEGSKTLLFHEFEQQWGIFFTFLCGPTCFMLHLVVLLLTCLKYSLKVANSENPAIASLTAIFFLSSLEERFPNFRLEKALYNSDLQQKGRSLDIKH